MPKFQRIFLAVICTVCVIFIALHMTDVIKQDGLLLYFAKPGPSRAGLFTVCPQDVRRAYIRDTCVRMNYSGDPDRPYPRHLVIDHIHKLAYCLVPKVASRTIRSILGSLLLKNASYICDNDFKDVPGISILSHMPLNLQHQVMEQYKKLIVVRHPFDRLISAYTSKIGGYHKAAMVEILQKNVKQLNRYLTKLRGNETTFDLDHDELSFEEFVGAIASEYKRGFRDAHWKTIRELCDPCSIDYDFVLRLETINNDYHTLATYLRPPKWLKQHATYLDAMKSSFLDPEEKMFNLLWRYEALDRQTISSLKSVYEQDMTVFGYTWDYKNGANCRIPISNDSYCC